MRSLRSSCARIYHDGIHIFKIYDEALEAAAANEAYWLLTLQPTGFVPELIYAIGPLLIMEYVGEPTSLPADAETQISHISAQLKQYDCFHRDIWHEEWKDVQNVLVKNNKLYLIDFAWATSLSNPEPTAYQHINTAIADEKALRLVLESRL